MGDEFIAYVLYLTHETTKSRHTIEGYRQSIHNLLATFSREDGHELRFEDVTTARIRRYLIHYNQTHANASTNHLLYAFRNFFGWLARQGYYADDPTQGIKSWKPDPTSRPLPTEPQVADLVAACDSFDYPLRCALAKGFCAVFVYGGLRRGEGLALLHSDITFETEAEGPVAVVTVRHGKGNKKRTVRLAGTGLALLQDYLAARAKVAGNLRELFVWLGPKMQKPRRFGEDAWLTLWRELRAMAGYRNDPRLMPHALRHAVVTRLLRNGVNLRDVQDFCGHASITTTAIYAHVTDADRSRLARLTELPTMAGIRRKSTATPAKMRKRVSLRP